MDRVIIIIVTSSLHRRMSSPSPSCLFPIHSDGSDESDVLNGGHDGDCRNDGSEPWFG